MRCADSTLGRGVLQVEKAEELAVLKQRQAAMQRELTEERIKAQKEEQAAKDAAEAKEEDRRADARETGKRIAHGEGYSKRKGNKE